MGSLRHAKFRVDRRRHHMRPVDRIRRRPRRLSPLQTGFRDHERHFRGIMQAWMVAPSSRGAAKAMGLIPCSPFIRAGGGPFPRPDDRTEVARQRLQPDARRSPSMKAPSIGPTSCERALAVEGGGSLAGAGPERCGAGKRAPRPAQNFRQPTGRRRQKHYSPCQGRC